MYPIVFSFGSTLSPGLVSYHVSDFRAFCHPASARSPSIVIGPVARRMVMFTGASAPKRDSAAMERRMIVNSRYTTASDAAEGAKLAFVRMLRARYEGIRTKLRANGKLFHAEARSRGDVPRLVTTYRSGAIDAMASAFMFFTFVGSIL